MEQKSCPVVILLLILGLFVRTDDLEGNAAEQAGDAVEPTFCSGWVGGQEETLRPRPGLPRGHLDRGNTRSVPGQTWSSALTHVVSHTLLHTTHVEDGQTNTWSDVGGVGVHLSNTRSQKY